MTNDTATMPAAVIENAVDDRELVIRDLHVVPAAGGDPVDVMRWLVETVQQVTDRPCAIDSPDPGPAGFSGSLVVAEFDSLEDAQAWADADPYVAAGVYDRFTVKPFRKVLP